MFRYFIFAIFIAALFTQSFGIPCGTIQVAEDSKKTAGKFLAATPGCKPEDYYGEVFEQKVSGEQPFIIYYTLEGLHKVKTKSYIDSLAKYLKEAYKLHKDSLGMRGILGMNQTLHYRKRVPPGYYPIEVVDTGLFRDHEGEDLYVSSVGLTHQSGLSRASQIAIENDFFYGANCQGNPSTKPFISSMLNYSQNWALALKITTFHELYHSFQFAQVDYNKNDTYWFEASAAGVEEIGVPEANDYISYIEKAFNSLGRSMEVSDGYEYAMFYLFLFSELGSRFDAAIWNYFSKNIKDKFSVQLARLADSLGIDVEDLFHKYAEQVFYSGKRTRFLNEPPFWTDIPEWPEWRVRENALRILPASAIYFMAKTNEEEPATDSVARISYLNYGDSSVWVLSRWLEKKYVPPKPKGEFAAYPNPWDPKRATRLYFKNAIQEDGKEAKVEIRSANGMLLKRISGDTKEPIFWEPEPPPAPGILYYRTLPNGKIKKLIVQY